MSNDLLVNFRDLPNIGVLDVAVPKSVMDVLSTSINRLMSDNFEGAPGFQGKLLGHLKKEFVADDACWAAVEPLVIELSKMYDQRWNYTSQIDPGVFNRAESFNLKNLWINFQKKHEFNPPHLHTGIFSFVIWIKIPYDLDEEDAVFPSIDKSNVRTSKFTFHYSNIVGSHSGWVVPVDKTFEGRMLFFPATLTHSVNPFFTSDEYRISVAGNIGVKL